MRYGFPNGAERTQSLSKLRFGQRWLHVLHRDEYQSSAILWNSKTLRVEDIENVQILILFEKTNKAPKSAEAFNVCYAWDILHQNIPRKRCLNQAAELCK